MAQNVCVERVTVKVTQRKTSGDKNNAAFNIRVLTSQSITVGSKEERNFDHESTVFFNAIKKLTNIRPKIDQISYSLCSMRLLCDILLREHFYPFLLRHIFGHI